MHHGISSGRHRWQEMYCCQYFCRCTSNHLNSNLLDKDASWGIAYKIMLGCDNSRRSCRTEASRELAVPKGPGLAKCGDKDTTWGLGTPHETLVATRAPRGCWEAQYGQMSRQGVITSYLRSFGDSTYRDLNMVRCGNGGIACCLRSQE